MPSGSSSGDKSAAAGVKAGGGVPGSAPPGLLPSFCRKPVPRRLKEEGLLLALLGLPGGWCQPGLPARVASVSCRAAQGAAQHNAGRQALSGAVVALNVLAAAAVGGRAQCKHLPCSRSAASPVRALGPAGQQVTRQW